MSGGFQECLDCYHKNVSNPSPRIDIEILSRAMRDRSEGKYCEVIKRRAASLTLLTLSFRQGSTGFVGEIQRNAVSVTAPFATVAHRVIQQVSGDRLAR